MGEHFPCQGYLFFKKVFIGIPYFLRPRQEGLFPGLGFHFYGSFGLCSGKSLAPYMSPFSTWLCFVGLTLKPEIT